MKTKITLIIFTILFSDLSVANTCDPSVMNPIGEDQVQSPEQQEEISRRVISKDRLCELLVEIRETFKHEFFKATKSELKVEGFWGKDYAMARAIMKMKDGDKKKVPESFTIQVNGGFLSRFVKSEDDLRLILCHELGHVYARYFYNIYPELVGMLPTEGYSDFFATNYCLKKINEFNNLGWNDNKMLEIAWNATQRINSGLGNEDPFPIDAIDESVTQFTIENHTKSLCRFTTLKAGLANPIFKSLKKRAKVLPKCWYFNEPRTVNFNG